MIYTDDRLRLEGVIYHISITYLSLVNVSAMLVYIHQKKYRSSFYS